MTQIHYETLTSTNFGTENTRTAHVQMSEVYIAQPGNSITATVGLLKSICKERSGVNLPESN